MYDTLYAILNKSENATLQYSTLTKMKTLHSIQSIYFDDKFNFGVNFFGHRIFNALSMSLEKLLDENHKLHIFL